MAKKKSKRFILPAAHFVNLVTEERIDTSENYLKEKELADVSQLNEKNTDYSKGKKEDRSETEQRNPVEKEIVKPEPLSIKNNPRRKSALSLASLRRDKLEEANQKSKQKEIQDGADLPKDPFTEETFLKLWNEYIDILHGNGEKIFASILKSDIPKIKKNLICVVYPNEMMKAELIKVRPRALKYLKNKLNNYSLEFEITVNE